MAEKSSFVASMVLSGVGDALGYKNGTWEFELSGKKIHANVEKLGGWKKLSVKAKNFRVSDDTVMHLATCEALVEYIHDKEPTLDSLFGSLAKNYKLSLHDMAGRSPGNQCQLGCHKMRLSMDKGWRIPYQPRGGGCGGAMRSMCIGLLHHRLEELHKLVPIAVESGMMTHNHPTGYLGALASAVMVALAMEQAPMESWGRYLLDRALPLAWEYVELRGEEVELHRKDWSFFSTQWEQYLKNREIAGGVGPVKFPEVYDADARDAFYKSVSWGAFMKKGGWGGSSGHDAPMIAYDALLNSRGSWKDLLFSGMWHGGDCDSTGAIAAACFGAMYGFDGVPDCHHTNLEYRDRLMNIGKELETFHSK